MYGDGAASFRRKLSVWLILFFIVSFIFFIVAGYFFSIKNSILFISYRYNLYLNDLIFGVIILLGLVNVLYMGYLPVLKAHRHMTTGILEYGSGPVFNTLDIFFQCFFSRHISGTRKKTPDIFFNYFDSSNTFFSQIDNSVDFYIFIISLFII